MRLVKQIIGLDPNRCATKCLAEQLKLHAKASYAKGQSQVEAARGASAWRRREAEKRLREAVARSQTRSAQEAFVVCQ